MLKIIQITSLFNQYSYSIDLNSDTSRVCFITGPNGYGKTNILNIQFALYNMDLSALTTIPFKELKLTFDEGYILKVLQKQEILTISNSDEDNESEVSVNLSFEKYSAKTLSKIEDSAYGNQSQDYENNNADNVRLYFASHPVYYIRDGRLHTPDGIPTVSRCIENMKRLLQDGSNIDSVDFNNRLELFASIINRADMTHKHLEVDRRFGFRFVSHNEDKTILSPHQLSSGEQHLTIMTFELLFMAPDDSLVLIDEPEISLHMMWQLDFLNNVQAILDIRDLQIIVATHSPEIFNQKWSLSVDLYRLTQN